MTVQRFALTAALAFIGEFVGALGVCYLVAAKAWQRLMP